MWKLLHCRLPQWQRLKWIPRFSFDFLINLWELCPVIQVGHGQRWPGERPLDMRCINSLSHQHPWSYCTWTNLARLDHKGQIWHGLLRFYVRESVVIRTDRWRSVCNILPCVVSSTAFTLLSCAESSRWNCLPPHTTEKRGIYLSVFISSFSVKDKHIDTVAPRRGTTHSTSNSLSG